MLSPLQDLSSVAQWIEHKVLCPQHSSFFPTTEGSVPIQPPSYPRDNSISSPHEWSSHIPKAIYSLHKLASSPWIGTELQLRRLHWGYSPKISKDFVKNSLQPENQNWRCCWKYSSSCTKQLLSAPGIPSEQSFLRVRKGYYLVTHLQLPVISRMFHACNWAQDLAQYQLSYVIFL